MKSTLPPPATSTPLHSYSCTLQAARYLVNMAKSWDGKEVTSLWYLYQVKTCHLYAYEVSAFDLKSCVAIRGSGLVLGSAGPKINASAGSGGIGFGCLMKKNHQETTSVIPMVPS